MIENAMNSKDHTTLVAVGRECRPGKGTTAVITIPDVSQSNGVIQVIDTVVMAE